MSGGSAGNLSRVPTAALGLSLLYRLQSGVSVRNAALLVISEELKAYLAVGKCIHFKSVLCSKRKWLYSAAASLQLPFVSK